MIIDVDVEFLIQNNITANQYIILFLLYKRKLLYLQKYVESNNLNKNDINELSDKKLIHYIGENDSIDLDKIIIRPKFRDLLSEGDYFEDFYNLYPIKINRPDGKLDYLRSNSNKCKDLYNTITKNKKTIHNKIMKCLEFEIVTREREGQMKWFKRMSNWLESEEWKNWEERMINEPFVNSVNKLGYGNELA